VEGLRNLFKPSRISKKARKEIPIKGRLDKPTRTLELRSPERQGEWKGAVNTPRPSQSESRRCTRRQVETRPNLIYSTRTYRKEIQTYAPEKLNGRCVSVTGRGIAKA
jgi:hypothetical protein